jgi:hypothetical protein
MRDPREGGVARAGGGGGGGGGGWYTPMTLLHQVARHHAARYSSSTPKWSGERDDHRSGRHGPFGTDSDIEQRHMNWQRSSHECLDLPHRCP